MTTLPSNEIKVNGIAKNLERLDVTLRNAIFGLVSFNPGDDGSKYRKDLAYVADPKVSKTAETIEVTVFVETKDKAGNTSTDKKHLFAKVSALRDLNNLCKEISCSLPERGGGGTPRTLGEDIETTL